MDSAHGGLLGSVVVPKFLNREFQVDRQGHRARRTAGVRIFVFGERLFPGLHFRPARGLLPAFQASTRHGADSRRGVHDGQRRGVCFCE